MAKKKSKKLPKSKKQAMRTRSRKPKRKYG